jgi:hypothetical protein
MVAISTGEVQDIGRSYAAVKSNGAQGRLDIVSAV